MGNFVYWMNVSLDLRIEQAPGENGGGDWQLIDEELHREFNDVARSLAVMVEGRVVYEAMESFWPAARSDASLPDFLREFGEIWTAAPKVLVSRSRTSADHNTRIFGGETALDQLAALREEVAGDIGVGGATVATQMLNAGLIDELLLFTHPSILGEGRPLFDGGQKLLGLELLEHKAFSNGVLKQRYALSHN